MNLENQEYRFKVTGKQQLLVLLPFIIINTILVIAYILILGSYEIRWLEIFVISLLLFIFVLPVIILHIQYLLYNKKAKLSLNSSSGLITFGNGNVSYQFKKEDISVFDYYATIGYYTSKDYSSWYTFGPYRYYRIILKNGSKIILTSLMINDIENKLEPIIGLEAERKFRAVPFIY